MSIVRNRTFWVGVAVGVVVGPVVLGKFAPGLKARIPG